jgi:hypothetical protein
LQIREDRFDSGTRLQFSRQGVEIFMFSERGKPEPALKSALIECGLSATIGDGLGLILDQCRHRAGALQNTF